MQTEKQRERLVELLNEATFGVNVHTLADHLSRETIERVAEYLMANNVVVLPYKVGDTVYCIWKYNDCFGNTDIPFIQESRVSGFVIIDGCVTQIIPENYEEMTDKWHLLLDVAFTKEEAENVLNEKKENGK